ncbi:acyl-CoA N-acyltransferase [Teratosphaeria destructans]|uniref:Acyl-CoA N-acyltransferase n=1 Tax=Teratosphaeria destructans TaxID=418781 RepID=A0A9W7VYF2_9PEZI|nr:acyl-CoA N-acyltransferase [Teratosphaeria destructans]
MLLRRACELADDAGYEMFVQANGAAVAVYGRVGGFEERERVVLEGGYEEAMLVRPAKGQGRRAGEV